MKFFETKNVKMYDASEYYNFKCDVPEDPFDILDMLVTEAHNTYGPNYMIRNFEPDDIFDAIDTIAFVNSACHGNIPKALFPINPDNVKLAMMKMDADKNNIPAPYHVTYFDSDFQPNTVRLR